MFSTSRLTKAAAALVVLSTTTGSAEAKPSDKYLDFEDIDHSPHSTINYFDKNKTTALEAFLFLQDNSEKILSSPLSFLEAQGYSLLSSKVNHELMKAFGNVPFFANTSLILSLLPGHLQL